MVVVVLAEGVGLFTGAVTVAVVPVLVDVVVVVEELTGATVTGFS